jgi:hypothetical protein
MPLPWIFFVASTHASFTSSLYHSIFFLNMRHIVVPRNFPSNARNILMWHIALEFFLFFDQGSFFLSITLQENIFSCDKGRLSLPYRISRNILPLQCIAQRFSSCDTSCCTIFFLSVIRIYPPLLNRRNIYHLLVYCMNFIFIRYTTLHKIKLHVMSWIPLKYSKFQYFQAFLYHVLKLFMW